MAAVCHFYRMTPAQYWDMDLRDHAALIRYMTRYAEEQERAAPRG